MRLLPFIAALVVVFAAGPGPASAQGTLALNAQNLVAQRTGDGFSINGSAEVSNQCFEAHILRAGSRERYRVVQYRKRMAYGTICANAPMWVPVWATYIDAPPSRIYVTTRSGRQSVDLQ